MTRMTSSPLNGVIAVLSAMLSAGGCGPDGQNAPTTAKVEQSTGTPPALASMELLPGSVAGGQTTSGIVTLISGAPAQGTSVLLSSSDSRLANVPASVLVDPGTSQASFSIATAPVSHLQMADITASLDGVVRTMVLQVTAPVDDPSTPGDDRPGWITCADGSVCQERCCRVSGPRLPWVCSSGGVCPGAQWGQSSCDGPEDCAQGQVCCPRSDDLSCQASCEVGPICHTDQDCPPGQVCGQAVEPWRQCMPAPTSMHTRSTPEPLSDLADLLG